MAELDWFFEPQVPQARREDARERELFDAAAAGDAAAVTRLRAAGVRAAAVRVNGMSPLAAAASKGHAAVIDTLLNALLAESSAAPAAAPADADADGRGGEGRTALMIAAGAGRVEAVDALLRHGASVVAEDARGARALHAAAHYGDVA